MLETCNSQHGMQGCLSKKFIFIGVAIDSKRYLFDCYGVEIYIFSLTDSGIQSCLVLFEKVL